MNITRRDWLRLSALSAMSSSLAQAQLPGNQPDRIRVPAKAVTAGPNHHWFGYYDKCPWNQTGQYLLAQESKFADRQPTAKDTITLGMVDLQDQNQWIPIATTAAWSWQQGTMLQWLGSAPDREVIFNSLAEGQPCSIIQDVKSGKSRTVPMPIYAVSPKGDQAVTLDFARLHRLRPGYGYASYEERFADDLAPDQLGIWQFDLQKPEPKRIVTLKQLAAFQPDERFTNAYHWVNHLQFNTDGSRFVFLHRWKIVGGKWFTRIFTAKPDGTDLRLHLDTGMVSHFDWQDDQHILAWVKTPKQGNRFVLIDTRSEELEVVGAETLTQDGHCSFSPNRKWILNDTYPDKDRLQWLMLYNLENKRRYDLNQFRSPKQFTGPVRCDLHPRWNRDGTQICFDGCHDAQRQVYVVDVREITG